MKSQNQKRSGANFCHFPSKKVSRPVSYWVRHDVRLRSKRRDGRMA